MVQSCYDKLAVLPRKGSAILFYSQHPCVYCFELLFTFCNCVFPNFCSSGLLDDNSLHGGCPVLQGQKWAANLWVWNGPRFGQPGAPKPSEKRLFHKDAATNEEDANAVHIQFSNSLHDAVQIYFDGKPWGDVGPGESSNVNSWHTHKWSASIKGSTEMISTFLVDSKNGKAQGFEINMSGGRIEKIDTLGHAGL